MEYQIVQRDETNYDGYVVAVPDGTYPIKPEHEVGRLHYTLKPKLVTISMDLVVEPEHRGRGIATRMIDHLHERYAERELNPGSFTNDGTALFVALVARRDYLWEWLTRNAQLVLGPRVPDRIIKSEPPRQPLRFNRSK